MDTHYYSTEKPHADNIETMSDYLDFEMPDSWKVLFVDGTYAEIETDDGRKYEVHASGDGDSFDHKIEFVEIKPKIVDGVLNENTTNHLSFLSESVSDQDFEDWFDGSVVVDKNGEPLPVYHGSDTKFSVFDEGKIGETHGRSEGAGFYFTSDKSIASGYKGNDGQLVEAYLSIKNPVSYDQKGFTKAQLKALVMKIAKLEDEETGDGIENGFLSNYGWIPDDGLNRVVNDAIDSMSGEDALDQISGFVGAGVPARIVNRAVKETLGYDGYWSKGFSNRSEYDDIIYVAMFPSQVRIIKSE